MAIEVFTPIIQMAFFNFIIVPLVDPFLPEVLDESLSSLVSLGLEFQIPDHIIEAES